VKRQNIRGIPSVDSTLAALDYASLPGTMKIDIAGSGAIGCAYSNRYGMRPNRFRTQSLGRYLGPDWMVTPSPMPKLW